MSTELKEGEVRFLQILKNTISSDRAVANTAKIQFAQAISDVIRDGVMAGDIVRGLYQVDASGGKTEYPIDFLQPGTEHLHKAYTMPSVGQIPRRQIEGDFVMIPVFKTATSIDVPIDYAEDANWFVVGRALQVMKSGFEKRVNDDGWHTILGAATDRNIVVYDADANAGQFTKRLVSLGKTVFARNAGGNSSSLNQRVLTDMALSLEGQEDIRNWGVDQIDEITRNQIYNAGDNSDKLMRIFGVNLHPLYELGEGQEYQSYFTTDLGGSLQGSDVELAIGMDLRPATNSFVMPIRKDVEMFDEPGAHRQGLLSWYGWMRAGYGVLDNRDCIILSF